MLSPGEIVDKSAKDTHVFTANIMNIIAMIMVKFQIISRKNGHRYTKDLSMLCLYMIKVVIIDTVKIYWDQ